MPMSSSGAVSGAVFRALVLTVALQVAFTAPAHRVLADDLAGSAAQVEGSLATGTLDESGFGFRLRVPDGWSIDIDAEDGPMLSWRMHRAAWLAGSVPEGLLALNITVIEPEPEKDVETEFRKFVGSYADRFLEDGEVVSFSAFFFGAYPGFLAAVDGGISQESGAVVEVSARVFIYETEDRQVIVSAVAPRSSATPLDHLGEAGSLIETSGRGSIASGDGTAHAGAPSPIATAPAVILPDTQHRLRAVSWGGGSLEEFGRLDADGLTVALPPGARTGGVGVASSGSPVALGDLDGGDATILHIGLDPARTDSLMIVLCQGQMVPCISEPSLQIRITATVAGAELSLWTEAVLVATESLPDGVPSNLTVRIDRDGVFVFPAGGESMLAERPRSLVPFAGLDVVIAALPTEAGGRLHMTALSVQMDRSAEMAVLPATDATAAVFPSSEADGWHEKASSGGDFAAFAALGADGLEVSVPAGHSWGVTGLVSARPMLGLPDGDDTPAPQRLRGIVDPAVSHAFAVAILPEAEGDVWLSALGYADVYRVEDDRFRVRIYTCGSGSRVAETFVDATWSGIFDLIVRPDRLELALDGQHLSATTFACLPPKTGAHVAVVAVAAQENEPASLRLTGLSIDRLPLPASVEAGSGPDAEFRPEDWIADIANDLSETDQ
jgi:hypothetical protein